jgi:hypothetical protein
VAAQKAVANHLARCHMCTLSLDRAFDGILAWDSFFDLCPDDQYKMFLIFREHAARGDLAVAAAGSTWNDPVAQEHWTIKRP